MNDTAYEFNAEQNRLIADLAAKMRNVGTFLVVVGTFALIGAMLSVARAAGGAVVALLLVGVFFLLTGVWSRRSGRYFRLVVDTSGHDIAYTMQALGELKKFYTLNFWFVIAYLIVMLSALIAVPSLG